MKQLQQYHHQLRPQLRHVQKLPPVLNLKFRNPAFSPCNLFSPVGFPPSSLPRSFPMLSFKKTTPPSRFILCNMNKNSDMMSHLELGNPEERSKTAKPANGIYWILLLNIGIYIADHIFQVQEIKALYLYHNMPVWYQFITATFCHLNWNHLSNNLFFLYISGKLVEEEEGNLALWLSYILTGAGANLVSWLVLPRNIVSIGASGAVFGLFVISVLVKISWNWRRILELLILGQFVLQNVMEAAKSSVGLLGSLPNGGPMYNINHIAHLSGALVGVALIWLLSKLPAESMDKHSSTQRKRS